jgi:hypothetical protein
VTERIDVLRAPLAEARDVAQRDGTTDEPPPEPVFAGRTGLQPGVDLHDRDALRELAHVRGRRGSFPLV